MAYSEILTDERKETAAGFWERARQFFADAGITIASVMTDNGSCYRSHDFAKALGVEVKHLWTRPYRPQTNGKVERFNRTLAAEWAYAHTYLSDEARAATYQDWIHLSTITTDPTVASQASSPQPRVHNLTGNYN